METTETPTRPFLPGRSSVMTAGAAARPADAARRVGTRRLALVALAALLAVVFLLSLAVGSVNIPLREIITVLTGGAASRESWQLIILNFRLPKALTALLAGAALAVGGAQMQTLFRNPLAEPYVLGISSGAGLGVALVILAVGTTGSTLLAGLGLFGDFAIAAASGLGAGLALLLALLVARRVQTVTTLLILGLMFGYITGSIISLLIHFSVAERVQAYMSWTFGSFGGVTWAQMVIFAPVVLVGLALAALLVKPLNALLLGEAYARSLGVNIQRARLGILISTALLTGAVTAFCGPIAFLGIAAPHICRGLLGTSDHRLLIPGAALLGAALALLADLVAQMPGSQVVLPLNAVMALVGAPVVVWVILRRRGLINA